MKNREEILNRIYKACFRFPDLEEAFFNDWKWVAEVIKEGNEDIISIHILNCINLWLNGFSFLTF